MDRAAVDAVRGSVKDALYVAVGLGVISAQSAQVRRRQLSRDMGPHLTAAADGLYRVATGLERRVDPVLDLVERRLPDPARSGFESARQGAGAVRERILATAAQAAGAQSPGRRGAPEATDR